MSPKLKRGYTVYTDEEMISKIKTEAKKLDRSESWVVNDVLEKYFKNNGE